MLSTFILFLLPQVILLYITSPILYTAPSVIIFFFPLKCKLRENRFFLATLGPKPNCINKHSDKYLWNE